MDDPKIVLERVIEVMKAKNEADLAGMLGIDRGNISNYKKKGFSRIQLEKIAKKTNTPLIYLEYGIDQKILDMIKKLQIDKGIEDAANKAMGSQIATQLDQVSSFLRDFKLEKCEEFIENEGLYDKFIHFYCPLLDKYEKELRRKNTKQTA